MYEVSEPCLPNYAQCVLINVISSISCSAVLEINEEKKEFDARLTLIYIVYYVGQIYNIGIRACLVISLTDV